MTLPPTNDEQPRHAMNRGRFLRNAGLGAAGLAAGSLLPRSPLAISFAGGTLTTTWWPGQPPAFYTVQNKLFAEFGKQNGLTVKNDLMPTDFGDDVTKFTTELSSGYTGRDVYWLDNFMTASFGTAGWLLPLEKVIPAETVAAIPPYAIKLCTYRGHLVGIPGTGGGVVFFYRKDVLDKLGLGVPKTWDDIVKAGLKIGSSSGGKMYGIGFAGKNGNTQLFNEMAYWLGQAGASVVNLKTPGARTALQYVWDNLNTHKIMPPDSVAATYTTLTTAFENDRIAMWPVWVGFLGQFQSNATFAKHAKVGVALPPKGPANNHTIADNWNFSISKYSKNPDLAAKFIVFMTSVAAQTQLATGGLLVPSRYNLLSVPAVKHALGDQAAYLSLYDKAGLRAPRPITAKAQQVSDAFEAEINQYLNKQISLDDAINTAQSRIDSILQG